MQCQNCGQENPDNYRFCGSCGAPVSMSFGDPPPIAEPMAPPLVPTPAFPTTRSATPSVAQPTPTKAPILPPPPAELPIEQRTAILDKEIVKYVRRGFQVVSRSEAAAQLVKPKKLSCGILLVSLLLSVIGIGILIIIGYLLIYLLSKPEQVYLQVESHGWITATRG